MITATGLYITGSVTEIGRSVINSVSETGEYAETSLTSFSIEQSYNVIFTDLVVVWDNISPSQQYTVSFSGDVLDKVTGSFNVTAKAETLLTGIVGVTGGLSVTQISAVYASGVTGIKGTFQLSAETEFNSEALRGATGTFAIEQVSEHTFKSTYIFGAFNSALVSTFSIVGFEEISGCLLADTTLEVLFAGLVTGLATAVGDLTSDVPTICMNTKTTGVSVYTGYNFNSFFKLGQDYYGCCSAGVFKLSGNLDDTMAIDTAVVRSGASDFSEQRLKAARDFYVYIRSDEDMSVRLITNEQTDRDGYPIYYNGTDGLHRRRVKVAQGIRGTTWQIEFKNEFGADFTLKQADLIPVTLDRSI